MTRLEKLLEELELDEDERSLCGALLYAVRHYGKPDIQLLPPLQRLMVKLEDGGVLVQKDDGTYAISPGLDDKVTPGTLGPDNIDDFLRVNAVHYRHVFARKVGSRYQGLRPGSMGDPLQVRVKLKAWFENTGYSYTWEEVMNTARHYVETEARNHDYQYLQSADYFIYKDGRSRLTSLIDEYGQQQAPGSTNFSRHA